jgi:hypothetical protein
MRTCFIHVGTHKTGTTSLQVLLNRHHTDLDNHQYLYPRTGRPPEAPDGHHNIAWEISSDSRFQRKHGAIDDLVDEILAASHNVILSSEDFECSIHHPAHFRQFIRRLQACHLAVKIVVYFRNHFDYTQSLYLEMLKFGVVKSFNEFVNEILDDGQFRWRDWIFPFCYTNLLTRLRAIEDIEVIARSYDRPKGGSVIVDCLSVFGLVSDTLGMDTSLRVNVRSNLVDAVGLFYESRKGTPMDGVEHYIIESLFRPLGDRRVDISEESKIRIVERFHDDMLPMDGIAEFDDANSPDVHLDPIEESLLMERVFSSDLPDQIATIARVFRTEHEIAPNERDLFAATCDSLTLERDHLIERCNTLVAQRDELAGECQALRNERQAILRSLSWKLTAPLRGMRSALR